MKEIKAGCSVPVSSEEQQPILTNEDIFLSQNLLKEEQRMIKVGKPAPQFSASAYYNGKFVNVSLEDYKGKWVYLCFYPGDFTFV
ncbi:peroxiredoxin (alkyl hydroperoxide reductase subunit C) [Sedimentibacter acidaminivorans]|uniref:Peroxiredoxin (Alkyl hydroperoxide reductase subunit C) n=3 Tax=Sedimentibacter acidaminivorans TaxID=913099 RepID=A0ABS4GFM8_9FIRM|nr:peroxiredoxin (alkyl hydroperoxide reductase subunit C) [Sedimentibacter acidaminivorans]